MSNIDGQWYCKAQSPMGEQTSIFVLEGNPDGSFTGTSSGTLGPLDVFDGQVTADRIRFKMELKVPFAMTLTIEASLVDDAIDGLIDTGPFGKFPVKGTRKL